MSDEQQDTSASTTEEQAPEASEWKPPASQADLDRIIQQRLDRERSKYADYDALAEKARYWDQIEQASKTELERLTEDVNRWQNEASTWRNAAVTSKVETIAAGEFADPSDALSAIDPSKYLGLDGAIDEAAIKTDLAALLERKPHWRRPADQAAPAPRVPAPNPAQGSGVNGTSAPDPAQQFAAILQGQLNGPR